MPAILMPSDEKIWLDTSISAEEALKAIRPLDEDLLAAYPVSNQVNRVSENTPELLVPLSPNQS